MARLTNEIIISAQPSDELVKLLCWSTDCKFNLKNAANTEEDASLQCGLKYITIDKDGLCRCKQEFEK
jgi:hypothetical protein